MIRAGVEERPTALAIAALLGVVVLAVAATVRLGWAADTRTLLGFGFAGVPAQPATAASIFANNARLLGAVFAAILIAQAPWLSGGDGQRGPVTYALLAAVDTILALAVAVNTALVGAALGAYGTRMAGAMLPHGPLELIAYALPLALYLHSRRRWLGVSRVVTTAVASMCLLAVAAALETFVVL